MRIAAFTKYDREAASTRQRVLQYLPELHRAGIEVDYHPLLGDDYVRSLVTGKRASKLPIAWSYLRRLRQVLRSSNYDSIWIYSELFPYLPGWFERLASRSGKPVVYDCDDAIFHMYDESRNPIVRLLLKRKLVPLLKSVSACCCGNEYLRAYAAKYCSRSIVLPTVVDTEIYRPRSGRAADSPLVIGWIGSPSTWANFRPLIPMLRVLAENHGVVVRAVGAGREAERDRFRDLELIEWSEANEVAEVQSFDIGIMPLQDQPFERGKCGYKLIQYMSCGLPVVASPVGVNAEIVREGFNGFLASNEDEWREALTMLITDGVLRDRMGRAGREIVVERYSLVSQAPRLVELFSSLTPR